MAASLTRRQFVVGASLAAASGAAAVIVSQHPWTSTRPTIEPGPTRSPGILVLVTLYGGNDGLNTVIPAGSPPYVSGRPTLGYAPNEVLPLGDGLGLHPSLKAMKAAWDSGQLAIVLGVGYPNPVRSHFRSMDIWQSASPDTPITTGWIGRWLDITGTDPMRALSIGATLPLALTGARQAGSSVSTTGASPTRAGPAAAPAAALWAPGPDRHGLAARVAASGADLLSVERTLGTLLAGSAPPAAGPAGQLELVARLIKAGATTTVYHVSLNGFDNHADEKAAHSRLLGQLDQAVSGFFSTLGTGPRSRPVTVVAYSEFGRRVAENASRGTDHGTAAPVFVAGPAVRGGRFYGAQPSLTDLDQGDLKYTTDFRSVYATVLAGVLGIESKPILGGAFPTLGFV